MLFSERVESVLNSFGVLPATKAALHDLYLHMGDDVFDAFADVADACGGPAAVEAEALKRMRPLVAMAYLRRNHCRWLDGKSTPSFYFPRLIEGHASGFFSPLCRLGDERDGMALALRDMTQSIAGSGQPVPEGVVLLGKNSHYCGRINTITFDVVCGDLEQALLVSQAEGRHHTAPGSLGATSGSYDGAAHLALLWEIQPHVYKPGNGRNAAINKVYRRHRNWHLATLIAALRWLADAHATVLILRGEALRPTHELNKNEPLSDAIVAMHEQTVRRVVAGMGLALSAPAAEIGRELADSGLASGALSRFIEQAGIATALYQVTRP